MENEPSYNRHYNYEELDKFLQTDHDPKDLGDKLDELMGDLVYVSRNEEDFGKTLSEHHYILRNLRDIFWALEKSKA